MRNATRPNPLGTIDSPWASGMELRCRWCLQAVHDSDKHVRWLPGWTGSPLRLRCWTMRNCATRRARCGRRYGGMALRLPRSRGYSRSCAKPARG